VERRRPAGVRRCLPVQERVPADKMLFVARSVTIALTLGWASRWRCGRGGSRRRGGAGCALAVRLRPQPDRARALRGPEICWRRRASFWRALPGPGSSRPSGGANLGIAGVVLGLAVITSLALFCCRFWRRCIGSALAGGARGGLPCPLRGQRGDCRGHRVGVVGLAYGPATIRSFHQTRLRRVVDPATTAGAIFSQVGKRLGLPAHPTWWGSTSSRSTTATAPGLPDGPAVRQGVVVLLPGGVRGENAGGRADPAGALPYLGPGAMLRAGRVNGGCGRSLRMGGCWCCRRWCTSRCACVAT